MYYFNTTVPIGSLFSHKSWIEEVSETFERFRKPPFDKPIVKILAYCLNPNHFHLLLQPLKERSVTLFMRRVGVGYSNYFNYKNKRSGALFQGAYKLKEVRRELDVAKVSVYVNCNAEIHGIASKEEWPWSSYAAYLQKTDKSICEPSEVLQICAQNFHYEGMTYPDICRKLLPQIKKVKNLSRHGLE